MFDLPAAASYSLSLAHPLFATTSAVAAVANTCNNVQDVKLLIPSDRVCVNGCNYPLKKTLHLTCGSDSITLVNLSGAGWTGSKTVTGTGRTGVFCNVVDSAINTTVNYLLDVSTPYGNWAFSVSYNACMNQGTCYWRNPSVDVSPQIASASGTLDCTAPVNLSFTPTGADCYTELGFGPCTITE